MTEHGLAVHIGAMRSADGYLGQFVLYVDPYSGEEHWRSLAMAARLARPEIGRACSVHFAIPALAVVR